MDGIFFLLLALLVIILSVKLSYYSDALASETKFGSLLIGGIILAAVTSLPEAITSLTSIYINNPYLAMGDILGSNIFNILIIGFFDIVFIKKMIMNKISPRYSYIISLFIYINIMIIYFFTGKMTDTIFNIGIPSIIIFVCYIIYLFLVSNIKIKEKEPILKNKVNKLTLKFIITSVLMLIVSVLLTLQADHIAYSYPFFSSSVIGAFMLGITTSLPEVVTVYTLIKINSYNLAVSNIVGSNMFNLLILAISDIFFRHNTIYNFTNYDNLLFTKIAILFGVIIIIQLFRKKNQSKLLYILPSMLILVTYLYVWYLHFF